MIPTPQAAFGWPAPDGAAPVRCVVARRAQVALARSAVAAARVARVALVRFAVVAAIVATGCAPAADSDAEAAKGSQHTAPDVPEWAKDAVWYQIFPERFRNGDPSNDPTVDVVARAWPYAAPDSWRPSRWTSDWFAREEWEQSLGDDFYRAVQARRYGGDLAGILGALPYLDSLGVNALYLNPVFDAPSLHKYDGSTFHHVDVHFGPDPEGDRAVIAKEDPVDPASWQWTAADRQLVELVAAVHARGMRLILDGVFNHMGLESFVFRDVAERQRQSRFADWIDVTSWDDPTTPDTSEFDWRGWVGVKSLPELAENEEGLLPPIRDYVFAAVTRWMDPDGDGDPSDGIDGWRLDVAEMVDPDFWRAFRAHVRSIRPDAYLVGELLWDDWANHRMLDASPWLQGDAFDAEMNYRWALPVRRLFVGSDLEPGESYGPGRFLAELAELRGQLPPEAIFVQMNTLGSHDTDRPASQVANPQTRFDHAASVRDDPGYRVGRPVEDQWRTLRLMLVHQFTYIGAPHLFYGDEAGMWGGDDPDERKPMVWADLAYDDEAGHPLGLERQADPVAFDHGLFAWYRRLIALRRAHPALRRGSFDAIPSDGRVLAYRRTFGRDRVWVALNLSQDTVEVTFDARPVVDRHEASPPATGLADLLGGPEPTMDDANAWLRLTPRTGAVLVGR